MPGSVIRRKVCQALAPSVVAAIFRILGHDYGGRADLAQVREDAVLGACRSLVRFRDGVWLAKVDAGRRLAARGEDVDVLTQALLEHAMHDLGPEVAV